MPAIAKSVFMMQKSFCPWLLSFFHPPWMQKCLSLNHLVTGAKIWHGDCLTNDNTQRCILPIKQRVEHVILFQQSIHSQNSNQWDMWLAFIMWPRRYVQSCTKMYGIFGEKSDIYTNFVTSVTPFWEFASLGMFVCIYTSLFPFSLISW